MPRRAGEQAALTARHSHPASARQRFAGLDRRLADPVADRSEGGRADRFRGSPNAAFCDCGRRSPGRSLPAYLLDASGLPRRFPPTRKPSSYERFKPDAQKAGKAKTSKKPKPRTEPSAAAGRAFIDDRLPRLPSSRPAWHAGTVRRRLSAVAGAGRFLRPLADRSGRHQLDIGCRSSRSSLERAGALPGDVEKCSRQFAAASRKTVDRPGCRRRGELNCDVSLRSVSLNCRRKPQRRSSRRRI